MSKELDSRLHNSIERIISGVFYATHQGDMYTVRPASLSLRQRAVLHYERVINSHRFDQAFRQEEFLKICVRTGVLDKDYKESIKKASKQIDELKIKLFDSWGKEKTIKRIRKELDLAKKSYEKQYKYLEKLKGHTLEGVAEHARSEFIFMNSIYDSGGQKVFDSDIENITFYNSIHAKYAHAMLGDLQLRALARSSEWRHLWGYKKQDIFTNGVENLTSEQKIVLHFSEMYDFAFQHEKPLPDSLIEDDDRFDGWYLKEVRRIKDERKANAAGDGGPEAAEVYKLVDTQEMADEVYDLNTLEGQQIIKDRAKQIKEKGTVTDLDFADVRGDLAMKASRQQAATINRATK